MTNPPRLNGVQRTVVALAVAAGIAAFTMTQARASVFVPMVAVLLVALAFAGELSRRDGVLPLDEIGLWFAAVIALYTAWPLFVFQIIGLQYTPFNDNRLFQMQPSPVDVGRMGWWHVAFLIAFVIAYLVVRRRVPAAQRKSPAVSRSRLIMTLVVWLLATGLATLVGLQGGSSADVSGYSGGYAAVASLPLGVRQILRLTANIGFVVNLVLLVWLFSDYRKRRLIIWLWLGNQVVAIILDPGARTGVMLSLLACLILYHLRVRHVRPLYAATLGVLGFAGFLAIGLMRALGSLTGGAAAFPTLPLGGEFESLFGNALDLYSRSTTGGIPPVPLGVYLADIVAVIPSQLLPFEKFDAANWYIGSFYPEALLQGHGLALGSIAQAVLGLGLPEVFIRGAILGAVFAGAFRFYRHRQRRLWVVVGYLWLTLWSYQSYRASTAALFSPFIQQFLVALLIFEAGSALLEGAARPGSKAKTLALPGGAG